MAGQNKENGTEKKQRKPKKKILIILCVCAAAAAAFFIINANTRSAGDPSISVSDVSKLTQGKFIQSVSAKGTVKSASSVSVYSTLTYPVQDVYVKVGDNITAGQPLAKLDDQSVLDKIESQQASINSSEENSAIQIKTANDTYKAAKKAIENGENSSILSAQQQVVTAWENYDKAVKAYERQKSGLESGLNPSILSQESASINAASSLDNANIALRDAQAAVYSADTDLQNSKNKLSELQEELKKAQASPAPTKAPAPSNTPAPSAQSGTGEIPGVATETSAAAQSAAPVTGTNTTESNTQENKIKELEQQIEAQQETIKAQEKTYDSAVSQLDRAWISVQSAGASLDVTQKQGQSTIETAFQTLEDYEANVTSAYKSYLAAEENLKAAQVNAQTQLQSYKNSLSSAEANANNETANVSLKQMQVELDSTNIKSPCSGTVTAVYAEVGKSGSGLLFVIEDLRNLMIDSSVKEYDIGTIKKGMPVEITSDATGGLIIPGEVSSIAPTSTKSADGTATTSGTAEFATEVTVTDKDTGLMVGMNVDLEYIVNSVEQSISVPYDAVYQNEAGDDYIMVLEAQDAGRYLVKEVPVKVIMENDLDIAISGAGLTNGAMVVTGASENRVLAGSLVTLGAQDNANNLSMFAMGPGGGGRGGGNAAPMGPG